MKKLLVFLICMMMAIAVVPASEVQAAKAKPKLSVKAKTLIVGKTYKIKLKNSGSKVKWKSSKKSVVSIQKKKGNVVTIKAKKPGKATITATYKKKKYKCKITVKQKKEQVTDNPVLNATDVTLYKRSEQYANYIKQDANHTEEFQFKVTGTKKEVQKWELVGEDAFYFDITDYGLVKIRYGSVYYEPVKQVMVKATLEDGRVLTATVRSYTEDNLEIERIFKEFKDTYITSDMSETEKAKKVAWYVSAISDYEAGNDDWYSIFIKGSGDCQASRYAVMYLCEYLGVKAQACRGVEAHGMTVVKTDGKFYLIITGYAGTKPRDYSMYEIDETAVRTYCEKYDMSEAYFGLE